MFKYLGHKLAYNDNNAQAMQANLAKARKSWGQVSCVLRAENALPKVYGIFYKATVEAVLLFGSELWKLSPLSLKSLEDSIFGLCIAWRAKCPNGILTGCGSTHAQTIYSKRWDYGQLTITLEFVGKPSPASSWTYLYLRSVRMGKGREDPQAAHFGGSSLCQLTLQSHCQGTKRTWVMITNFVGDIFFGWATCTGSS